MKVLLVEDDDAIALPLVEGLSRAGFEVTRVSTVRDALAADVGDVVLLDLGLPDGDGLDVARTLRGRSDVPIIVISARDEELDRVIGLEVGADDYVVKPFGMRELVARIRAVLRRATAPSVSAPPADDRDEDRVSVGELTIDRREHRVSYEGRPVALTPKEFDLLDYLARDPGAAHRREAILDAVWEHGWYGPTRTLDVHIASLRKKLGDASVIETVRGVGFRLRRPATGPGPR